MMNSKFIDAKLVQWKDILVEAHNNRDFRPVNFVIGQLSAMIDINNNDKKQTEKENVRKR